MTTQVLSASTLSGDKVKNTDGEDLGHIEDFMIDLDRGQIRYAVLSFGEFLGMGDKLFAVPWEALSVDTYDESFILNVPREKLEDAPGFDQNNWPDFADREWDRKIHQYYGYKPHW